MTSTTLMANMPGFEHAVKLRKEMPRLGVGVHLTLTCGKPLLKLSILLSKAESSDPYLIISIHLTLTKINCIRNGMLRFKIYHAGIIPTHLDSHHHTHTLDENQEVVVTLAKYDLPVRSNFERKMKFVMSIILSLVSMS